MDVDMSSQLMPAPGLTLRPVKRKKRPSFSPQKWRSGLTPKGKQRSQSQPRQKISEDLDVDNMINANNPSALEFEEFSFVDDNGTFNRIGSALLNKLLDYMAIHYQAESLLETPPYLVVFCTDKVPPPSERPFMVAGLVAVWLVHGKESYPEDMNLGDLGRNDDALMSLGEEVVGDLKTFIIPKAATVSAVMAQFPEAAAVSYINHTLIIELKEVDAEQHQRRLDILPYDILGTDVLLKYHNGPIHGRELKRLKEPNPKKFDGLYDDTDYVKVQGCFNPGSMLSSRNGLISAGILVEKQGKIGLTVAIHCWDQQLASNIALGSNEYIAKQGHWEDGTTIGKVTERIGTTDIGIVELQQPFSNRFLDLEGSATSLLSTNDVTMVNESFWIDSFVTGRQHLASSGVRVYKADKRGKVLFGHPDALPGPGTYIELVQGIYSTSTPEINRQPQIREGVCSAAVVRAQHTRPTRAKALQGQGSSALTLSPGKKTPSTVTPLRKEPLREGNTGEVAGFMHWSDIQSLYNGNTLLCFADSVDDLIEDGWAVVKVPKKRTASGAGLDDPFVA